MFLLLVHKRIYLYWFCFAQSPFAHMLSLFLIFFSDLVGGKFSVFIIDHTIFANTSGGAWTLNLPASPSAGDEVTIVDYASSFNSDTLKGLS